MAVKSKKVTHKFPKPSFGFGPYGRLTPHYHRYESDGVGSYGVEMTANVRIHSSKFPSSLDSRRQDYLVIKPDKQPAKTLPKSFGIESPKRVESTRQTRGILRRIAERNE